MTTNSVKVLQQPCLNDPRICRHRTYARPIRVYVWYPAKATSQPMRFGRYAALADDNVWPGDCRPRVRRAEVLAWAARPIPAPGRFPLIAMGKGSTTNR